MKKIAIPPYTFVEAVIGPRFPGINKRVREFDFKRHYGAEIKELRRSGRTYTDLNEVSFREGDTLVVLTDDSFIQTWGESSVFLMLANGKEYEPAGKKEALVYPFSCSCS